MYGEVRELGAGVAILIVLQVCLSLFLPVLPLGCLERPLRFSRGSVLPHLAPVGGIRGTNLC
jgi:hypothetical protein